MLDARCWMLDAGCSMLDARFWMLDARCWMLDAGCWMLYAVCCMLYAGCRMPDAGCRMLHAGCWMLTDALELCRCWDSSDSYELDELVNTLSTTIIDLTKAHFAHHGIPLRCLTDDGPQFVSCEYKNIMSSPYWSRSNGKAEAAISDAKSILKKYQDVYLALLNI